MTTTETPSIEQRTHQPWCTNHQGQTLAEWGYCSTGTQDVGGYLVDANDGSLSGDGEVCLGYEGLTTEQGRELARTILHLCDVLDAVPGVSATLTANLGAAKATR